MKISRENAERLLNLFEEISERVTEFKNICRKSMGAREYELFKYNCLAHLEPGLTENSDWIGNYTSLEEIALDAADDATEKTSNIDS